MLCVMSDVSAQCTGIFATVILEKLGPKRCGTCGVVLMAIGVFASSLAPNLYTLYLTYGLVTGAWSCDR